MDALTAIGLVANILQFIDFGIKLVSKGNQAYRSSDGTLPENQDLAVVTNDLLLIQTTLTKHLRPQGLSSYLDEDDQALEKLAITSNELVLQLLKHLNRVDQSRISAGNLLYFPVCDHCTPLPQVHQSLTMDKQQQCVPTDPGSPTARSSLSTRPCQA